MDTLFSAIDGDANQPPDYDAVQNVSWHALKVFGHILYYSLGACAVGLLLMVLTLVFQPGDNKSQNRNRGLEAGRIHGHVSVDPFVGNLDRSRRRALGRFKASSSFGSGRSRGSADFEDLSEDGTFSDSDTDIKISQSYSPSWWNERMDN